MNRALLVGINTYPNGNELHGCVNDILDVAHFLHSKCGFAKSSIRLLSDKRATTKAILERLQWLIKGIKAGDRIFFHYSGHGAQVASRSTKGEVDGLDEVICPVDFDWTSPRMIKDKEFQKLFSKVPKGVEFVWVSDSCHSADLSRGFRMMAAKETILSKPRRILPPADIEWRIETAKEKKLTPMTMAKAPSGSNIALISGCKSDQTSADAYINKRYNGALTYYLLKELNKKTGTTQNLEVLVKKINADLKKNYTQEPQLEGSSVIMHRGFLMLK